MLTGCAGKGNDKAAYKDSLRHVSELKQQLRLDSIRQEEMLLDSLREDSIRRRSFTTYDLTFNELHSDVKECINLADPKNYIYEEIFRYNEEGGWINIPVWDRNTKEYMAEMGKQLPKTKLTRDNEGRINNIYWHTDDDVFPFKYFWEDDKVVKDDNGDYKYREDGLLAAYLMNDNWIQPSRTVYTDYVLDGMGNWIERKANYFNYVGCLSDPTDKGTRIEKRKITYYNSNGEGRFPIEDSPIQTQLLEKEKQRFAKTSTYY